MRIIDAQKDERVITEEDARLRVEYLINGKSKSNKIYVLVYNEHVISISGEYYKIAWMKRQYAKQALSNKFGKELSQAMLDYGLVKIVEVDVFKKDLFDIFRTAGSVGSVVGAAGV